MNLGVEDETLEFKRTTGELNEAMASVCAMLNKHGRGTIYFGVHPNGEVKGQEVTDATLRDISRKIHECIVPPIIPKITRQVYEDRVVVELAFSGVEKPYSCRGIYYIRSADEDRVLPPNELRQLFEYNKNASWDRELTEYTIKDIDKESFDKFYKRAVACSRIKDTDSDPEAVLSRLGLIVDGRLTNAAYYLFSSLEPVVLKMAVFATDEKLTFLDINRTKGNIIELIDKANEYVKERINWRAEIEGLSRVETPEIPLKALREIICNSFAHARYNTYTEHEIDIHPGKVVIYNPGAFPIGYDPEDFVRDNLQSMVRNPLILDTLYLSDDVEAYSSGLKRVYSECEENNVKVDYTKYQEGFSFIFNRDNSGSIISTEPLSATEKKILGYLRQNPECSMEQMAELSCKSSRTIQRYMNSLKEKGYVSRVGGTRGSWQVLREK